MKAEADAELLQTKKQGPDSLKELEAIKTMQWHRTPLDEVFSEFNYKWIYSQIDPSYYKALGVNS